MPGSKLIYILLAQANLPALTNVEAIRALTTQQTTAYATSYGLGQQGGPAARRAAIGRKVGCPVTI